MECYCYLRNIQDRLSDAKTPYERRFGEPFKGPIVPSTKKDIVGVDHEELEEMDASEIHAKRLSAKEVILHKGDENYKFPVVDGTVQISGEDQELRTST